jgi:hypothetical protein
VLQPPAASPRTDTDERPRSRLAGSPPARVAALPSGRILGRRPLPLPIPLHATKQMDPTTLSTHAPRLRKRTRAPRTLWCHNYIHGDLTCINACTHAPPQSTRPTCQHHQAGTTAIFRRLGLWIAGCVVTDLSGGLHHMIDRDNAPPDLCALCGVHCGPTNHYVRIALLDGNASDQTPTLVVACSQRHLDLIEEMHTCGRASD